jgi:hypothetical protein
METTNEKVHDEGEPRKLGELCGWCWREIIQGSNEGNGKAEKKVKFPRSITPREDQYKEPTLMVFRDGSRKSLLIAGIFHMGKRRRHVEHRLAMWKNISGFASEENCSKDVLMATWSIGFRRSSGMGWEEMDRVAPCAPRRLAFQ